MTEPRIPDGESAEHDSLFWSWDTGAGDEFVENEATLSSEVLQLRMNVKATGDGDYFSIPLEVIRELHYSRSGRLLEIYHDAPEAIVIRDRNSVVHRKMYQALRDRLAPGVKPAAGALTPGHSISRPATGLLLTIVLGGLALALVATYHLPGFAWALGTVCGLSLFFAAWIAVRLLIPLRAEVIFVRDRHDSTGNRP